MPEVEEEISFKNEIDKLLLAMDFIAQSPLDKILDTVEVAHTLGPFIDPTKYRDALQRGHMDEVARLARALQEPVRIFNEMKEKYGLQASKIS